MFEVFGQAGKIEELAFGPVEEGRIAIEPRPGEAAAEEGNARAGGEDIV